jgi:hypothetical protein
MDFDSFFRSKIESMVLTASWVEQVQKMLDLDGVSQVWGDRPEWYIWIDGAPGVYALVFEEGETIEAANQTLHWGQFVVKCYPYTEASVFEVFSPREREIINSDLFDQTHTPRLEARHDIPESLFAVGSMSFILDANETIAMFAFDSLDLLRWSILNTKNDQKDRQPNESVIRSIPAWQIGYPLFDRLISLYAFYSKHSPAFIGATQSPGFDCIIDAHQTPESRVCDDSQHWSASVLFVNPAEIETWVDTIWRAHLGPAEKIVLEHECSHSACNHTADNGFSPVDINSLWWELAHADLKSELASTCGCEDHEHHAFEAE